MKLGQQVCFTRHYAKNGSEYEQLQECADSAYDYKKLVPVETETKVGIVVGKRNLGTISHLYWEDDKKPNELGQQWICIGTTKEQFYLVACDLVRFYKVKESDLREVPE